MKGVTVYKTLVLIDPLCFHTGLYTTLKIIMDLICTASRDYLKILCEEDTILRGCIHPASVLLILTKVMGLCNVT